VWVGLPFAEINWIAVYHCAAADAPHSVLITRGANTRGTRFRGGGVGGGDVRIWSRRRVAALFCPALLSRSTLSQVPSSVDRLARLVYIGNIIAVTPIILYYSRVTRQNDFFANYTHFLCSKVFTYVFIESIYLYIIISLYVIGSHWFQQILK